jgi:heterodisulfide reductase subunit A2
MKWSICAGKVSKLFQNGDRVTVKGVDTLSNRTVEIEADLVVLATAVIPRLGNRLVAEKLGLDLDMDGFFRASDEEMDPVISPIQESFWPELG